MNGKEKRGKTHKGVIEDKESGSKKERVRRKWEEDEKEGVNLDKLSRS